MLSRRPGQSLLLEWAGQEVEVKVLAVDGIQVKLGIVAPLEVVVLRGELRDRPPPEGDGRPAF